MPTHKILADLNVGGEVKGTSLDINGAADISGQAVFGGEVVIPEYIVHLDDGNTYFGFHNADEWRVVTGGTERFEITNSGATFAGKIQTSGELEGGSLDINGNADIAGNLVISGTTALDVTANIDDNWAGRFENTDSGGYGILAKIAGTSSDEKVFEARVGGSTKMAVTGDGNSTFAGNITSTAGYIRAHANSDTVPGFRMQSNDNHGWEFLHRATEGDFALNRETGGTTTEALRISRSNGNATFAGTIDSGSITSTGIVKAATTFQSTAGSMAFFVPNVGQALEIAQNTGDATFSGGITVGVNDTGHDVKFFGATAGKYLLWDESADALTFPDSTYLYLGAGNDLQLYHNGTDSHIANYVGDLYITNFADDKDIILRSDDGSGGTAAYLTIDGGSSQIEVSKSMRFADGIRARFGGGADVDIYHDGSNSYIKKRYG